MEIDNDHHFVCIISYSCPHLYQQLGTTRSSSSAWNELHPSFSSLRYLLLLLQRPSLLSIVTLNSFSPSSMSSFRSRTDDGSDGSSEDDDILPSCLNMNAVLNGSPTKHLPATTETEALEAPAEVLDASANAITDANAIIGATDHATDGDVIPASGELSGSERTGVRRRPLSVSDETVNLLDYGDDGPPEFHDAAILRDVNSVLPLPPGILIIPVHKVKQLSTNQVKELSKNLQFNYVKKNGNAARKNISSSGSKVDCQKRIATWFYLRYRQDKSGDTDLRPISRKPEISRLVEIMVDPNLSSSISLLHMPASRPEIDGAPGGSINDSVWAKVVQKNYNDMENSKPPFRFPDDPELGPFNPNDASISARGADNMKSQWASLRSKFTVCYARWGFSAKMIRRHSPISVKDGLC